MMVIIMVVHVPHEDVHVTHLVNEELGISNPDPPVSLLILMLSRVTFPMNLPMPAVNDVGTLW